MFGASSPGWLSLCRIAVALLAVVSWGGCAAKRSEPPLPGAVAATGNASSQPRSTMALDELVETALRLQPDEEATSGAWRAAVQGREFHFFAEVMARAAREQKDRPEITGWLRISAAWVGAGRRPVDQLSLARELSHRECCTRANYLGAAIEGWAEGLSKGGRQPAGSEIETRWRIRDLADHADPRIAVPARAALAFFPGDEAG